MGEPGELPSLCILSPCLFNLYAEYIMRNAGLEEAQAEIKIALRNINHLRYADVSRSVIAFLPRSKRLLISQLQSPSAVILEPRKIKSDNVSIVSPLAME